MSRPGTMVNAVINHDSDPPIHCSSEWHMRADPRAFMIYSIALRITDGGKNEFYLSKGQLVRYFQWDRKTVKNAFRALETEGLFKLVRSGRGGQGKGNFASVYRVIPHSKLESPEKCWPTGRHKSAVASQPSAAAQQTRAMAERPLACAERITLGEESPLAPGKNWSESQGETGTLVSDHSTKKSTNPSQASLAPDSAGSATPQKINTNPSLPRKGELPEDFHPDESNVQFAKKNGLDLEEERTAFSEIHGSIGNERSNWQAVFRKWLENAAVMRGRITVPDWIPVREWNDYLHMRERIRRGATPRAQELAVEKLAQLRARGRSVTTILQNSIANETPALA